MIIVRKERLMILIVSLVALLSYSFPFSSYMRLFVILSSGCIMFFMYFKAITGKGKAYIISLILFCLWGASSFLWAKYKNGVNEQVFNMLNSIVTNIIFVLYFTSQKEDNKATMKWLAPVMLIFLLQSIMVGSFNWEGRFSPSGATNQFGMTVSFVYLLSLYGIKYRKYRKDVLYLLLVISAGLVVLSGSRKALFNLLLFTCLVMMFSKYDKNWLKNIGKLCIIVVLLVIVVFIFIKVDFLYQAVGRRIVSLIEYSNGNVEEDLSAMRRANMKKDAISMFLAHPVRGVGLNNYKFITRYETYAHSNIYELLANLGLIGFTFYYIPVAITSVMSFFQWKRNEADAVIPFAIMLSFCITEFSNISYMYRTIHVFVGLAAGMIFLTEKNRKTAKKNRQEKGKE